MAMTVREKLTALIEQLPEAQLGPALEQLQALHSAPNAPTAPEAVEFVIQDVAPHNMRRPLHLHTWPVREKATLEVGETSGTETNALMTLSENARWWRDHHIEIRATHTQTHIAISRGVVFQATSYLEALTRAQAQHPDDMPFIINLVDAPLLPNAN
jgi:hypothetical protein